MAIEAEPRAEPRKDALVAAAYTVLATRGFEGLRTREVAAMVGVNIATLHYYFPHKEDLIRGVVGYAMGRFRGTLGGAGSAEDQLRTHFVGLRRLARHEPGLLAVMAELATPHCGGSSAEPTTRGARCSERCCVERRTRAHYERIWTRREWRR